MKLNTEFGSGVTMGRKARHSDSEFEDDSDFDSDELNMEQEEDDDEHDGEEEEEESENEEEDGREDGEEENGDEKNDNKDAEMEELEKEYMNLRYQEQDILKNLKRHKDEDLLKGQAVKNQKALWDKALEFRFLLQKAFSNSNRLPQTSESSKNIDGDGDEDWSRISQLLSRIATFRDKSINKWQRKTEVTTGAAAIKSKLHAFNQNISEQVASYMRDGPKLIVFNFFSSFPFFLLPCFFFLL
ncbi:protein AATF-like [Pyrus ussuriensis x Pyrus communis]|uniref:Protein AATF-like n=1 Tax=Pyrus ussuriensis x Pyrus communis TaxID=2448454 RepID=A0A5N5HFS1_9ROSA|nr:protein AATF-like [Pyrus ussuriensis x Pyrus communis]